MMKISIGIGVFLAVLAGRAGGDDHGIRHLLVVDKTENMLRFLDPASLETVATIPVGRQPHEVAVSIDGKRAYVSNYGGGRPGDTISVIDVEERKAVAEIDLGEMRAPHGLAVSRDGKSLYVTCEAARSLVRLGLPEGKVEGVTKTGKEVSHMVALAPDGKRAYVSSIVDRTVTVIETAKDRVIAQIAVEDGPEGIDVSPDGKEVWVANRDSGSVSVIDAEKDEVVETIPCEGFPIRVKFTPDGGSVLVSCARAGEVAIIDPAERKETGRVPVGTLPIGIVIAPDGKAAFVANGRDSTVSVIDLETKKVKGLVAIGKLPDGLAIVRK